MSQARLRIWNQALEFRGKLEAISLVWCTEILTYPVNLYEGF